MRSDHMTRAMALVASLAAATMSACIVVSTPTGSAPDVAFQSIPPGAQVASDEGSCSTPCRLKLNTDRPHSVTISAPGYKPFHVDLQSQQVDTGIPWWMTMGQRMTALQPNPIMAVLDCADENICGARVLIKKYGNPTPSTPP